MGCVWLRDEETEVVSKADVTPHIEERIEEDRPAANLSLPCVPVPKDDDNKEDNTAFFVLEPTEPGPKGVAPGILDADPRFFGADQITGFTELMLRYPDAEVVLDFETTALTPWSAPERPEPKTLIGNTGIKIKDFAGEIDARPRARVLSIAVPAAHYAAAFDLDRLNPDEQSALAEALSGGIWVGHNLAFDLQWLFEMNPDVRPTRIIDTMLLTTACRPSADVEMQGAVAGQMFGGKAAHRRCASALEKIVTMRAAAKKRDDDDDDGAMSLKALSLWLLDEDMDKSFQKPHNWMLDTLSAGHYDYVMGDVTAPGIIARRLLGVWDNAPVLGLLDAIDANPGGPAYRVFESAMIPNALMQHKGIRWDHKAAEKLDDAYAQEAQAATDALVSLAPALALPLHVPVKPTKKNPFPDDVEVDVLGILLNPSRNPTAPVKAAIAEAIQRETGRSVRVSDSGNPVLDAKALAFDFPGSKVVKALVSINTPTKARQMLKNFSEAAVEGRLHPLVSIKTTTGRTASQEPALQQVPRDPRFRAVFTAPPGYQILATDYGSIELRIAAALGVRAWRELRAIVDWATGKERTQQKKAVAPLFSNISWLLHDNRAALLAWLSDDTQTDIPAAYLDLERPVRGAPIEHIRDYKVSMLCQWVSLIRKASGGDEAHLPFREAYVAGLDPHLLTAIAMQVQGGQMDTGGKSPMGYIKSLSADDAKALKHKMKDARQAAKAVNFGSLYGQKPAGLHRFGVTGFGLDWTVDDAAAAQAAWFRLYPEIGLWHWLIEEAHKEKRDILDPYNSTSFRLKTDTETGAGKVFWGSTLSGRRTVSPKITSAANYQDQGTGAEIALAAVAALPPDVQGMLVNFVHDEFVLEVPTWRVPEVTKILESTMIAAADDMLLPFGVPTEVESSVGDYWIH